MLYEAVAAIRHTVLDLLAVTLYEQGKKMDAIKMLSKERDIKLTEGRTYLEGLPDSKEILSDIKARWDLDEDFEALYGFWIAQHQELRETKSELWERPTQASFQALLDENKRTWADNDTLVSELNKLRDAVANGQHWRNEYIKAEQRIHDLEHYITNLAMSGTAGMPLRGYKEAEEDSHD